MAPPPTPIEFSSPLSLPLGSLILVTGVNGLIASHIADQLLSAGYRVCGTVRNKDRTAWVEPLFKSRHPGGPAFELIQVSDLSAPGAWDEALSREVAGIAAVAGSANIAVTDVDAEVEEELHTALNLLEAAKGKKGVRSVALTGSYWAACTPKPGVEEIVDEGTWYVLLPTRFYCWKDNSKTDG